MKKKQFDRHGPNACKVQALLRALRELSADDAARLEGCVLHTEQFFLVIANIASRDNRQVSALAAMEDAMCAVAHTGSGDLMKIVGSIAAALIYGDRVQPLNSWQTFDYIVSTLIPGYKQYEFYDPEDSAIEYFCEQLSKVEGHEVYVVARPDDCGANGTRLPDAVIKRGGEEYVLDHTAVCSYTQQINYEDKFKRAIKNAGIEEAVMAAHPGYGVEIIIPVDAFKTDREIEQFDLQQFARDVVEAVGSVPAGYNHLKHKTFSFPNTRFDVHIARHKYGTYCHVDPLVPINMERLPAHLDVEVTRAVNSKRKKLTAAKEQGARTILLLDSEDHAMLSHEAMAKAFGRVAPNLDLSGIDEVFTIHNRGTICWVLPAKIGNKVYPNLPEFEDYWLKRVEQYGVRHRYL